MRVLLVEDDALLGSGLRSALGKSGFEVTWVRDGETALAILDVQQFVALVLDIGLPKISGTEVVRRLRAQGNPIPILVLTAGDSMLEKVINLECGADDFLAKTVELEELVARLRAVIRRSGHSSGLLQFGALRLDLDKHTLTRNGESVKVSKLEFSALRALMEGVGKVLTRGELVQAMYGQGSNLDSNAVEVHIHNLRAKIGASTLLTVRGIGYSFVARQER